MKKLHFFYKILFIIYIMISHELYIIITHIVFVIISFYTILMTLNPEFKITNLEKINAWILFGLYSTYLFFFKEHVQLFTNESHILSFIGLILFCIGFYGSAMNSTYNHYINEIHPAFCYLIGSICFVLSSIFIEKNTTLNNHVFSLYDGMMYFIGSIFLLFFIINKKQIYLTLCLFLFLFGRLLALYMSYKKYNKKTH